MMAFAATTSLTSCGSDDDTPQKTTVASHTFKYAQVDLDYTLVPAIATYFDVTVTITDFDGNVQTIPVTGNLKQTITGKSANGTAKIAFKYTAKSEVPFTTEEVELTPQYTISATSFYEDTQNNHATISSGSGYVVAVTDLESLKEDGEGLSVTRVIKLSNGVPSIDL